MDPTETVRVDRATLEAALDAADVDLRESYSGRWMSGETCLAVVGRTWALARWLVELALDEPDLAIALTNHLRMDDLDTETVWYFPGYQVGD